MKNFLEKPKKVKEPEYLEWVRDQVCWRCEGWPSEPHHVVRRSNDRMVVPTCRLCHELVHRGTKRWRGELLVRATGYWEKWLDLKGD